MAIASNLGFPRIGAQRELKKAVESFWKGDMSVDAMLAEAKGLRATHWNLQKDAGIQHIPSGISRCMIKCWIRLPCSVRYQRVMASKAAR